MSNDKIVSVLGGTGNQGGATARELLSRGWQVRALVRDPGKAEAQALEELGATLVKGDLEDTDSLRAAVDGVHGVFSVQALAYEPETLAAEVRHGKAIADAAKEAGVAHFVYSSVGGAERQTGIDHFESKWEIEEHIKKTGLPATVLRPVFFMNNLLHFADARPERLMRLPVKADKPMQFIASDDIGFFAATAFDNPAEYIGKEIELAGDEITFPQVAEIYERVTGVPTRFEATPVEERMFEWFAEEGYQADIPALRRIHPGLLTLEEFLTRRLRAA
ncbi:NmrA/HSCARG family protein [Streptomyces rubradiris]|uniref:NmrA family transcriptional regulator n=1 Tax=Streptomyces rubradiris TaxID=285531 RepID=A0ABQ3REP9_STRRR|nr:NmrA/HSCARG family protein [Streptomyces rubradiris]GHG98066.1 NmrA family transcriptional regulator [Streptomyces rubradiris]GHI54330.1 NmrA family transcriptional regulator [Streptomyces rubradiris]